MKGTKKYLLLHLIDLIKTFSLFLIIFLDLYHQFLQKIHQYLLIQFKAWYYYQIYFLNFNLLIIIYWNHSVSSRKCFICFLILILILYFNNQIKTNQFHFIIITIIVMIVLFLMDQIKFYYSIVYHLNLIRFFRSSSLPNQYCIINIKNWHTILLFTFVEKVFNYVVLYNSDSFLSAENTCSLKNTNKRGAQISFIPYTYELTGCLTAHKKSILIIIHYIYYV